MIRIEKETDRTLFVLQQTKLTNEIRFAFKLGRNWFITLGAIDWRATADITKTPMWLLKMDACGFEHLGWRSE